MLNFFLKMFKFINKHFGLKFEKKTEDFFSKEHDFLSE